MASIKIKANCYHCSKEFIRGKYDINKTLKKSGTIFCSITCGKQYSNKKILEQGFSENKACKKCNIERPRTNEYFTAHKKTLDGFDSWCKICRGSYRSEIRRGQYRSMISDENLKELIKTENCIICGSEEKLVVDHCHATDIVRGMLCNNCNMGLGHFKDDPLLLEFARIYLLYYNKDSSEAEEYLENGIANY
jgi:hypothetical protein